MDSVNQVQTLDEAFAFYKYLWEMHILLQKKNYIKQL